VQHVNTHIWVANSGSHNVNYTYRHWVVKVAFHAELGSGLPSAANVNRAEVHQLHCAFSLSVESLLYQCFKEDILPYQLDKVLPSVILS
jgi:hypothetical protein